MVIPLPPFDIGVPAGVPRLLGEAATVLRLTRVLTPVPTGPSTRRGASPNRRTAVGVAAALGGQPHGPTALRRSLRPLIRCAMPPAKLVTTPGLLGVRAPGA